MALASEFRVGQNWISKNGDKLLITKIIGTSIIYQYHSKERGAFNSSTDLFHMVAWVNNYNVKLHVGPSALWEKINLFG